MGLFDRFTAKGRRDEFARKVMASMTANGWPHPMRYDAYQWRIDFGGPAGELPLEPLYDGWRSYPKAEREGAFAEVTAFIFDLGPPPPLDEAKALLMPIIRPRIVAAALDRGPGDGTLPDGPPPWRGLSPTLAIHIAVDRPNSSTIVDKKILADWGISFDEAMSFAMGNLRRREWPELERQEGEFFAAPNDDYYDLSRMLVPETFAGLAIKGVPVAVAPIRRRLLVAGSEEPDAIDAMAGVAAYLIREGQGRPVSHELLALDDGVWRPFAAPVGSDNANALPALQTQLDYETENPLVVHKLSREDRALAIADVTLMPREGGGADSIALWIEAACLLPKADLIVIRTADDGTFARRWDDVETACGGFPREPDTASPYAVVKGWPTGVQLAQIAAGPEPEWAQGRGVGVANGRITLLG